MKYIQVIDGKIVRYSLPKTGRLKSGEIVSGYDKLSPEMLKEEGWLPLEDIKPTYDEAIQYLETNGYDIQSTKVVALYNVVNKPLPDIEEVKAEKILQSKVSLALYLENNPYEHIDGKKYTVTEKKQGLLTSQLLRHQLKVALDPEHKPKWNAKGETCNFWEPEALSYLALCVGDYVEPLVTKQQEYEVLVNNCKTFDELNLISDIEW